MTKKDEKRVVLVGTYKGDQLVRWCGRFEHRP